jgi:hypothetical protein
MISMGKTFVNERSNVLPLRCCQCGQFSIRAVKSYMYVKLGLTNHFHSKMSVSSEKYDGCPSVVLLEIMLCDFPFLFMDSPF